MLVGIVCVVVICPNARGLSASKKAKLKTNLFSRNLAAELVLMITPYYSFACSLVMASQQRADNLGWGTRQNPQLFLICPERLLQREDAWVVNLFRR